MNSSNSSSHNNSASIDVAVKVLEKGGVISFLTETFYGLGVDPFDQRAVEKLFFLKKRSQSKPILVLIPHVKMLPQLVSEVPELFKPLIKKHWPGPLTLIFPALHTLSPLITGNSGTIGIRISSSPVVKEIFAKWDRPLTATSANISNRQPAKNTVEVRDYFGSEIDCVLDGGESVVNQASTIVGVEQGRLTEIRKGIIPFQDIAENDFL